MMVHHFRAAGGLSAAAFLMLSAMLSAQAPADPIEIKDEVTADALRTLDIQGTGDLVHADAFGPYFIFGSNKTPKDSRRLVSLKDGKVLGTITGKFDIDKPVALSPSGKYFAAWRGFFAATNIAVFDAKGKPFAELKNLAKVEDLRFFADDRLGATSGDTVTVWDLPTKKVVSTIILPKRGPFGPKPIFGPNGRSIFTFDKAEIKAFDATGKEVAKYTAPRLDETFGSEVKGAALHPDGKTLALFIYTIRKSGIALLDTGDATFKGPFEIEEAKGFINRDEKPIDWSAKGDALLVRGKFVADPESGKVLWQLPDPPARGASTGRLISASLGLAATDAGGGVAIKATSHNEAKIAELVKAARSGVKITDAALPKLTEVTLTGVKVVDAPATPVAWAVKPDPAASGKLPTTPLKLDVGSIRKVADNAA